MQRIKFLGILLPALLTLFSGCSKQPTAATTGTTSLKHEHHPLHGGTPVVLGDELYHVELLLDPATGRLQAYIFDGELENFIRVAQPALTITATLQDRPRTLVLLAVANSATGETVGDTALFEVQADWLRGAATFDAALQQITIRGTTFADVKFNFPRGNDRD
jgi:hypothetical protein